MKIPTENDNSKFKNKVIELEKKLDISSVILAFAIDLIEYYELSLEDKERIRGLIRLSCNYEWTDARRNIYFSHIFNEANMQPINSWQVKVKLHELELHELKHYTGLNETVDCYVEIGNQKFKTKEKNIDNLNFENEVPIILF